MASKTWSYRQITQIAESSIRDSLALAERYGSDQNAEVHRLFAWGALHLWIRTTSGWQKKEDYERLKALLDPRVEPVSAGQVDSSHG